MNQARDTRSTCPYCGVGCGVIISAQGDQITGVRGDPEHPANQGRLCTKGSTLHLTASADIARQTRLLQPLRRAERGGATEPLGWDAALDEASARLSAIAQAHGPEAIGFYLSGQLLTEDYYAFNKLAKGLIGTPHIDSNSRLCMSSAVAGYKATLGADAPPAAYADIEHAHCLFIAGSNTAWAHPIVFRRIEAARRARPELKIIVVDPRRTETAEFADLHLALQPGTDTLLFHGLLHLMLWEGWTQPAYIEAHTQGFDALKALVRDATPAVVAQTCGLREADLVQAARWFATSPATLSLYCQGLNQSANGTAKNAALINLHLATAQIGRAGAGPLSLTGQPNAMGGREVGAMANLLSAHRDLANPQHRAEIAALWGVDSVPERAGKTAVELFQAAADGEIKALWIACTNPAQSMPDQLTVRRALQRAEYVVVQEAFATSATCALADLLLPATTWGEKEGTVTNSERCISRVRAAVPPPGQTRHDWQIAVQLGQRLERVLRPGRPSVMAYAAPVDLWNEHRESTRGRDLDITGLSYALLEQEGPQQWPRPEGAMASTQRLYTDGVFATPDGRARFAALPWQGVVEPCTVRHPFALNTGRLRDQWHGMTRTGTLGQLFGQRPEPSIDLHPQDMARLALSDGDLVYVTSVRATQLVPARGDTGVAPGQAFMAMHWGPEVLGGRDARGQAALGVNALTLSAHCPVSHQPELKHAAVKIVKAQLPWSLLAMAWVAPDQAQTIQARLAALMPQFNFALCVPFGHGRCGVLFRAASEVAAPPELLQQIQSLLGLDDPHTLRYDDRRRNQHRAILQRRSGEQVQIEALMLAGDTQAQSWLKTLLLDQLPAQAYGRWLLRPGAQAPDALPVAAVQICTCLNVTEQAIRSVLETSPGTPTQRLGTLQERLRCGTQCGSCLPTLRRLESESPVSPRHWQAMAVP